MKDINIYADFLQGLAQYIQSTNQVLGELRYLNYKICETTDRVDECIQNLHQSTATLANVLLKMSAAHQ